MMRVGSKISIAAAATVVGGLLAQPAWAQKFPNLPITPQQSATAQKVAQAGVPLSELAPNAPDSYVVKRGDTLWGISKLFLRSPWRWPELWGMNLEEILNPHLIFPGQTLYLEKIDGRARLVNGRPSGDGTAALADPQGSASTSTEIGTVRLSPRVRQEPASNPLTTLQTSAIEPFLAEPLIVEENELTAAPRIVAAAESRVVMARGDRVYARGPATAPLMDDQQKVKIYRVFRNATALKDPDSGEVLGYQAEFLGKAALVRSESTEELLGGNGDKRSNPIPATIDILSAKSEMQVGDRMVPETEREFLNFVPRVPNNFTSGRIVSVYGSAVVYASQNQVVVINRGRRDGMESGHVLAILKDGERLADTTDASRPMLKLPNERNGLLMVFRTFEKLSYGLILDITDGVRVGDRLALPQ